MREIDAGLLVSTPVAEEGEEAVVAIDDDATS
jgi:hypothetical protein